MRVKYFVATLISCVFIGVFSASAKDLTTSDVWLDSEITTIYTLNEHLNPFDISVDVKDGVVSLGGEVDSSIEKALAVEIARGVEGVKEVKDNIKIDPTSESHESLSFVATLKDASLVAKVKSNLLWNKETSGMDINVDADGRIVTLKGDVSSDAERELAVRIAENTSGVRKVKDELSVPNKPGLSKKVDHTVKETERAVSDTWITTKIKSRFLFDKHTDGFDIAVTTKNGIVTLEGEVPGKIEKDYAVQIAQDTVHVKKVVDKLKVQK